MSFKQIQFFQAIKTAFVLLFLTIVLCHANYPVIHFNKCPSPESVFLTMVEISLKQCVEECTRRPSCGAVGYKRSFPLCELSTSYLPTGISDDHCMEIFRSDMYGKANICGQWDFFEAGSGCVKKECPPQPLLKNGKYLGNMNQIGSKKAIICDPGYREQTETSTAECMADGTWSYNGLCKKCPLNDSEWIHFSVPEDFDIMIVTMQVTHSEAVAFCNDTGARLVQIDQRWKKDYIVELLTECTGLSDGQYWVDGSPSADNTEVWKFSDGSPVPMAKYFWHDHAPNDDVECVRVVHHSSKGYRLDDKGCSHTYRFICENTSSWFA